MTDTTRRDQPLVLMAEDYVDTVEMYRLYLSARGWRVVGVANGANVVPMVRSQQPDVIVMDLSLPQIDGWELTRLLKTAPATAHIPIVVVTGNVMPDDRLRATAAGCDSFLAKPCLPETLERELRLVLAAQEHAR